MDFEFRRHRTDKVSQEDALDALERAAQFFGYVEFGKRDLARAAVGSVPRPFGMPSTEAGLRLWKPFGQGCARKATISIGEPERSGRTRTCSRK
jgi:hypothetical protein